MTRFHLWAWAGFFALGLVSLFVGLWLRAAYTPEWRLIDTTQQPPALRPWAVEADCYSQLARVQRILRGDGLIQSHFKVENWPEGLIPSTTAPFDYTILLLYAPLALFTAHPLDWAGALVSPVLWAALVLFWMLFRSREFNLAGRTVLLIGAALLPALIWATAFGRPRHQSLILLLMAIGLTAEYERWIFEFTPKRAWNILAGIIWGLACWTSLFEPLIVLVLIVAFNLIVRHRENFAFLVSYGTVMLIALALEGFHIFNPYSLSPQYQHDLLNWLGTIGEVQPVDFAGMFFWLTLGLFAAPWIAWRLWPRAGGNKTDALLILLTLLLVVFMALQKRWIYYASLAELILFARYYQLAPWRWTRILLVVLVVLSALDTDLKKIVANAQGSINQPSLELCEISRAIDTPGGILAPWWLSPGLLYFSGHPIVSGSSHCGITGIVASSEFFAESSWPEAEQILKKRQVRWVVVWDDPGAVYPLLNSALGVLGAPYVTDDDKVAASATMAQVLLSDRGVPSDLQLRGVTDHLKLYEYVPDGTPSP